jgi:WD domain, G-beta repeat
MAEPGSTSNPGAPLAGQSAPTASNITAAPGVRGDENATTASAAAGTTAAASVPKPGASREVLLDTAVIEYLRKKGMESAAAELNKILKEEKKDSGTANEDGKKEPSDDEDRTSLLAKASGGGLGYDRDAAAPVAHWGVPDKAALKGTSTTKDGIEGQMGVEEARALLDSFTSFQLWVLGLPDQEGVQSSGTSAIVKAQQLIKRGDRGGEVSLASVVNTIAASRQQETAASSKGSHFHLPPSAKPELFAIAFALLVHTYCELLEVGMESTAHVLRDTFKCVYEPLYGKEMADLFVCVSTEDMMRLNSHNAQHMEALASLKGILVQVTNYQLKRDELQSSASSGTTEDASQAARQVKLQEYDRTIAVLQQKYNELSQRASMAFNKMHDLPFLRRARAVRWQLFMSTTTHALLSAFLNANDTSLLAMNTLLQTKCELHVERRAPLSFTPACVLDDSMEVDGETTLRLNKSQIGWAAPAPHQDPETNKLAFPKFQLDEEYNDSKQAMKDKEMVEFNRALLVNGFRRLEALERMQLYEVLPELKLPKESHHDHVPSRESANPLEPTVLMSTICCNPIANAGANRRSSVQASGPSSNRGGSFFDKTTAVWEEAGVGLCCAAICPPVGSQVAVGCDDAAVRIYNQTHGNNEAEPEQVLLGHKNGFPVFGLSWNRDGRSLLSCAGDGTARLWDTKAVGSFGGDPSVERASSSSRKGASSGTTRAMSIPIATRETSEHRSGAALAVYRGHAPNSPIWSVSFAPCGYYFATAGADATVRLWTTDREVPVRLFTGHTSMMVNCVDWNPNSNYIISGMTSWVTVEPKSCLPSS